MLKVIKTSKQNIPSLCNKMHMKLNKGINKTRTVKKNTKFIRKDISKTYGQGNLVIKENWRI
jgi:hypothetical protein